MINVKEALQVAQSAESSVPLFESAFPLEAHTGDSDHNSLDGSRSNGKTVKLQNCTKRNMFDF